MVKVYLPKKFKFPLDYRDKFELREAREPLSGYIELCVLHYHYPNLEEGEVLFNKKLKYSKVVK